MIVSPQFAWLMPIHRHGSAPNASRTNQAITKLWVMSRSWRSSSDGVNHSATASAICAVPASICSGRMERKNGWKAGGMSGPGPLGMQSISSADGCGFSAGRRSVMTAAVSSAGCSGEVQAPVKGTPPRRSAIAVA
jgi:hypothetical protein